MGHGWAKVICNLEVWFVKEAFSFDKIYAVRSEPTAPKVVHGDVW